MGFQPEPEPDPKKPNTTPSLALSHNDGNHSPFWFLFRQSSRETNNDLRQSTYISFPVH